MGNSESSSSDSASDVAQSTHTSDVESKTSTEINNGTFKITSSGDRLIWCQLVNQNNIYYAWCYGPLEYIDEYGQKFLLVQPEDENQSYYYDGVKGYAPKYY
jgi:hypothetical protein